MSSMGEIIQKLCLRVLYTINSSPQYILAKTHEPVPVTHHPSPNDRGTEGTHARYAKAPLKACLTAICNSSPELLHDISRDFSLYVLDPLEVSPAPCSNSGPSPPGVAVALGLMSWALQSKDSGNVYVTGTVLPGSVALEVVFALRETNRIQKVMLNNALESWSKTAMSFMNHSLIPSTALSTSFVPVQSQPQTLTRSAEFPEVYVGPPRRGRGRPEGSISSRAGPKPSEEGSTPSIRQVVQQRSINSEKPAVQPLAALPTRAQVKTKGKSKSRQTRGQHPPTRSPFICAPLVRSASMPYPNHIQSPASTHPPQELPPVQQQSVGHEYLMALVSAIAIANTAPPSSNQPVQNAEMLKALQQLLAAGSHLQSLPTTSELGGHDIPDQQGRIDSANPDNIVLDSLLADTSALCKRSTDSSGSNSNSFLRIPDSVTPLSGTHHASLSPMPTSTPSSAKDSTAVSSSPSTSTPTYTHCDDPQTPITNSGRRTLTDLNQGRHSLATRPSPLGTSVGDGTSDSMSIVGHNPESFPDRLPSMLSVLRKSLGPLPATSSTSDYFLDSVDKAARESSPSTCVASPPSSTTINSRTSGHMNIPGSSKTTIPRKRTLEEFMVEHEAREREKSRKRLSSKRHTTLLSRSNAEQNEQRHTHSMDSSCRYVSPCPESPPLSPTLLSHGPPNGSTSLTTQSHQQGSTTNAPTGNPLKKFVLPAWARTNTTTLPRLSDEAQVRQLEEEAKKAKEHQKRRQEAKEKRRKLRLRKVHTIRRRQRDTPSKESSVDSDEDLSNPPSRRVKEVDADPLRIAMPTIRPTAPSLPVFASDTIAPIASPPSRRHVSPLHPKTPPRKRLSCAPTPGATGSAKARSVLPKTPHTASVSPEASADSLFTPSGALFTPSTPTPSHYVFTHGSPSVGHRSVVCTPRKNVAQMPQTPRHQVSPRTTRTPRSGRHSLGRPSPRKQAPESGHSPIATRTFIGPPQTPTRHVQVKSTRTLVFAVSAPEPRISPLRPDKSSPCSQSTVVRDSKLKQSADSTRADGVGCEPAERPPHSNTSVQDIGNPGGVITGSTQGERCISDEETDEFRAVHRDRKGKEKARTDDYVPLSPLPPSSPLPPISPPSSPGNTFQIDMPALENFLSDSDAFFPRGGFMGEGTSTQPGSDSAWITDTDYAWWTDSESGPWLESDGAWLSDSDAIFGDISSLPPWTASNLMSDLTGTEMGESSDANVGAAPDRTLQGLSGDPSTMEVSSEFWESLKSLLDSTGELPNMPRSTQEV